MGWLCFPRNRTELEWTCHPQNIADPEPAPCCTPPACLPPQHPACTPTRWCADNRPFSEIVAEAKAQGYTEPDPRDDLAGMDVARKVTILAR